jgi:antitoxin component of MazEF toxin-antitoxin module
MRASNTLYQNGQCFRLRIVKLILEELRWAYRDDLMAEIGPDKSLRLQTLERYVRERVAAGTAALGNTHSTTKLLKSGSSMNVTVPTKLLILLEWRDREELILETQPNGVLRIQTLELYLSEEIASGRRQAAAAAVELHA